MTFGFDAVERFIDQAERVGSPSREESKKLMAALTRQPMKPGVIKEITDELLEPVSEYRHARPHTPTVEPDYTEIVKRPRRVKATKD